MRNTFQMRMRARCITRYRFYITALVFLGTVLLLHDFRPSPFDLDDWWTAYVQTSLTDPSPPRPLPPILQYSPHFASNDLFLIVSSYLINGDASNRINGGSSKLDDLLLVVLGIGDFGKTAQPQHDEHHGIPPFVPRNFRCMTNDTVFDYNATLHKTGTAFEASIGSRGNVRYFGERVVMISCHIPSILAAKLIMDASNGQALEAGTPAQQEFKLVADENLDFGWIKPNWYLSQATGPTRDHLVLCTTAAYGLTGSRWLTEWLFYHHFVQQFDNIEVYAMLNEGRNGPKALNTLYYLLRKHPTWLRAMNWSSVIKSNMLDPKLGIGKGVPASGGFEHGQRLARTDCYLRNRHARFIAFLDIDELLYTPREVDFKRDITHNVCNKTQVCQFKSVTVFPLIDNPTSELLLEQLSPLVESHCVANFNCGEFNFGREKYLAKAQANAGPTTVLAIHSISDSIPFAKSVPHHVVPKSLAFIRHYNPTPYKTSGGYADKANHAAPFPRTALDSILEQIHSDAALMEMCSRDSESFLRLDNGQDAWRFKD